MPAGHRRVRADGTRELVAFDDGQREFSESWLDLLRSCKRRRLRAPVLASASAVLGCPAVGAPDTREQRCWFHKIANVLNARPRFAQPGAKAALAEIWNAKEKEHARAAAKTFADDYTSKCTKATAKVTDHLNVLLAFSSMTVGRALDPPAHHPIKPTFTTVRLRHWVTKGPGTFAAGIAKVFTLMSPPTRMACRERTPPRHPRPRRREVREGRPRRKPDDHESGGHRQVA
ncbi:transposase [Rhodococcus sp. NPDC019627]|uniref:transposase n=1 Tax=unclassified Rhodococcus (in: high G+C Gram-positive bacteria) TaxID=192944 RepID=UPI0033C5B574